MLSNLFKSLFARPAGPVPQPAAAALTPGRVCALADQAYARGELDAALRHARQLIDMEPAVPEHVARLARYLAAQGDAAQAMRTCERALEMRPDFVEVHSIMSEIELPGEVYTSVIRRLHDALRPRTYVEVGIFQGQTLALASPHTRVIGIDPEPQLRIEPHAGTRIHRETSDAYFAGHDVRAELGGLPVDMAFIDGMHCFDFALRDFMNLERLCKRDSVILVHDCHPLTAPTAERERKTAFWSGDVWRLIVLLCRHRPDLKLHTLAAMPTGLGFITGLDPQSRYIEQHLDELIAEGMALDYSVLDGDKAGTLNLFPNDWSRIRSLLPPPFSAPAA